MTCISIGMRTLALLSATVVAACSSSDGGSRQPRPDANNVPTVSAIGNQTVNQDTVVGPIQFAIGDAETAAANLTVVASADATTIFPADGIVLDGAGANRSITLTPLEQRTGTATIAVLVTDAQGGTATRTFTVTVNARNASFRDSALGTLAKVETAEPTAVSGFTFAQDADDPATFAGLVPPGDPPVFD
jgi:hypothetical protein